MSETHSSRPSRIYLASMYAGTVFVASSMIGATASFVNHSRESQKILLSLFGPSAACVLFLVLLAIVPGLLPDPDDGRVALWTVPLAWTALHLCIHIAVSGNPIGPFSRFEHLPGAHWSNPILWVVAYFTSVALLSIVWPGAHKTKTQ